MEVGPVVGEEAVLLFHLLQKLRDAWQKGGMVVPVAQVRGHRGIYMLLQKPVGGLTDDWGLQGKQGSRRHKKGGGGGSQERQKQGKRERFPHNGRVWYCPVATTWNRVPTLLARACALNGIDVSLHIFIQLRRV